MEKTLSVEGMHCKSCEILLADVLSDIPGISNVKASQVSGKITFQCVNEAAYELAKQAVVKENYKVIG